MIMSFYICQLHGNEPVSGLTRACILLRSLQYWKNTGQLRGILIWKPVSLWMNQSKLKNIIPMQTVSKQLQFLWSAAVNTPVTLHCWQSAGWRLLHLAKRGSKDEDYYGDSKCCWRPCMLYMRGRVYFPYQCKELNLWLHCWRYANTIETRLKARSTKCHHHSTVEKASREKDPMTAVCGFLRTSIFRRAPFQSVSQIPADIYL